MVARLTSLIIELQAFQDLLSSPDKHIPVEVSERITLRHSQLLDAALNPEAS